MTRQFYFSHKPSNKNATIIIFKLITLKYTIAHRVFQKLAVNNYERYKVFNCRPREKKEI